MSDLLDDVSEETFMASLEKLGEIMVASDDAVSQSIGSLTLY